MVPHGTTPSKEGLYWNLQANAREDLHWRQFLTVSIRGVGNLNLIPVDKRGGTFSSQVLYVPDLGFHLLSTKELCELARASSSI